MKELLEIDKTITIKHNKMFKSLNQANIKELNTIYTLAVNENKRVWVKDKNTLIDTKPIFIKTF